MTHNYYDMEENSFFLIINFKGGKISCTKSNLFNSYEIKLSSFFSLKYALINDCSTYDLDGSIQNLIKNRIYNKC